MRNVAAAQEVVRDQLAAVRGETSQLPAFDWAFEQIALDMARCVVAAQRFRISPDAAEAARAALRKLRIVQQAIDSSAAADTADSSATAEPGASQNAVGDNDRLVPALASLKLLRGLQADINDHTKSLEAMSASNPRHRQLLEELSVQQKGLGKRVEQLMLEIGGAAGLGSGAADESPDGGIIRAEEQ
jgi:hypothetical protein